ncbi:MAG: DUF4349 domain-containing protein [Actinomycetota bacterium]
MNTQIDYLEELREDLLSAAWREADRAPARRRFSRTRRLSRGNLIAACLATVLVLSAGVGWIALGGDHTPTLLRPQSDMLQKTLKERASENQQLHDAAGAEPAPSVPPSDQSSHVGAAYTTGGAATAGAEKAVGAQGDGADKGSGAAAAGAETSAPAADFTRIIKTAQVGLVVLTTASLEDRFDAARSVAHRNGGFVTKSSIQPGTTGEIVIRVPARNFDATITSLEKLGSLEHESINGQDVTSQFVDLQARLSIAQTHRDVLEKLLAKAHSPEQIVRMQNLLDDAQLKVEQLQGEIRLIKNQTSKATIDLSMRMAGVALPLHGEVKHPGLGSAWAHAIAGFFGVVFAVVVGLGYLVPIAVILVIAWLVFRRVRRRESALVDD